MKVTVEVDCTPIEARTFFGLPDVQPMQAAMMAEMEKNIMKEAQRFTPDALMQTWFASIPQSTEWFREMFNRMIAAAGTASTKPTDPRP